LSRVAATLTRSWAQRGPLATALWPISWLFQLLVSLRRSLYRAGILTSHHPGRPVVIVGNLVAGGAGKTPLVVALAEALKAQGRQVGVVSRGYGRHPIATEAPRRALGLDASVEGDEVVLIARRTGLPVYIGNDRAATAALLVLECPNVDIILSDDGLQHYRLARDFEIVVLDKRGIGNGWLLPAGPLREPQSRLAGVDAWVFNQTTAAEHTLAARNVPGFEMSISGNEAVGLHAQSPGTPGTPLKQLRGKRLVAMAGIGQPQRFFDLLMAHGLDFTPIALPDHFDFRNMHFDRGVAADADIILLTEKDAVKCRHLDDPRLWVVPITAHVDPALVKLILEKIHGPTSAGHSGLSGHQGPAGS